MLYNEFRLKNFQGLVRTGFVALRSRLNIPGARQIRDIELYISVMMPRLK
jgi:hypothetical protein